MTAKYERILSLNDCVTTYAVRRIYLPEVATAGIVKNPGRLLPTSGIMLVVIGLNSLKVLRDRRWLSHRLCRTRIDFKVATGHRLAGRADDQGNRLR
jgi:hypothetical protein